MKARVYNPTYSGKVHQIASMRAGIVTDTEGNEYPAKLMNPVPTDAETVPEVFTGGDARKSGPNRALLQRFVEPLKAFLARPRRMEEIAAFLKAREGFAEAIARTRMKKAETAGFLRLFPEHFSINTPRVGAATASAVRRRLVGKQRG